MGDKSKHDHEHVKHGNVQDMFLNQCRRDKVNVTMFLMNGVKLQGIITAFDNFSVILQREGHVQLIYKHAVSTVMPSSAVKVEDTEA